MSIETQDFTLSENVAIAKFFGKTYTPKLFLLGYGHLMLDSDSIDHPSDDSLYTRNSDYVLELQGHPDYPDARFFPRTPEGLTAALTAFKAVV